MKAIPVKETNREAIEAALKEINGNSTRHTYTSYEEIEWLAEKAEEKLSALMYNLNPCCLQRIPAPRAPAHDFSAA